MERIEDKIREYKRIAFDTNLLIYIMEKHPIYFDVVKTIFTSIEKGQVYAVTSMLIVTEILTKPLKDANRRLVQQYKAIVSTFPNISIRNIDYQVAVTAAKIRAEYGIKTPDALFIATAIEENAEAFVTNDSQLARLSNVDIILLDDYV